MCSFLTPSLLLLYSGSQHVGGSLIAQSPSFLRPHGLYPARSSIHGISQARILEWVAISFSRAFFYPRNRTQVSCIAGRLFTDWATCTAWPVFLDLSPLPWRTHHLHVSSNPHHLTPKLKCSQSAHQNPRSLRCLFLLCISCLKCNLTKTKFSMFSAKKLTSNLIVSHHFCHCHIFLLLKLANLILSSWISPLFISYSNLTQSFFFMVQIRIFFSFLFFWLSYQLFFY